MTRLINDTDETLILEPGESIDIKAETETRKVMSKRKTTHRIQTHE